MSERDLDAAVARYANAHGWSAHTRDAVEYLTIVRPDGTILFTNQTQPGVEAPAGRIKCYEFVAPEHRPLIAQALAAAHTTGLPQHFETEAIGPDGQSSHYSGWVVRLPGEGVDDLLMIGTDVTHLRRVEEDRVRAQERLREAEQRLLESQKLRAIGALTGGIAHDFNNHLTVLQGCLELTELDLDHPEAALEHIQQARQAAGLAANLTQRLLAIGRRQALSPEPLDAQGVLTATRSLLERTLEANIHVEVDVEPGLGALLADRPQLESALLNLAINARDAMGVRGGRLRLRARALTLDERNAAEFATLEMGRYVRISVEDDGPGIAPEIRDRVFEPFFTTKDEGRGSGLGLSMVLGFVRQSGGDARIEATPGGGTTVTLFLPSVEETPERTGRPTSFTRRVPGTSQRVLLVEDLPAVARMVGAMLDRLGHAYVHVGDGEQALRRLEAEPNFTVLLTDLGLPGGYNGIELAAAAKRLRPTLQVLYMTGYDRGLLEGVPVAQVLHKPFELEALQQALERGARAP